MPDYSRLQIKTENNTIVNAEDFKNYLQQIEIDENIKAYFESLLNHLNNSTFTNKDEIINAISNVLIKQEEEELNNKQVLEKMQQYNADLKRINIIETSGRDNDSKKDINYITFKKADGTVEMLATRNSKAISEMLKTGSLEVSGKSAEEIFHYFKEYKYFEVDFMTPEEMDTVHPEAHERAVKQDDYIRKAELQEVENYRDRYYLPYEVEVAVDQEGERIYRLGDGIIKFKDEYDGSRKMVFLQQPTMTLNNNNTNNQVNPEEPVEMDTQVDEQMEEVEQIKREDMTDLSLEEFRNLIYEKEVNHHELSIQEEAKINNFVSYLIGTMVERYESGDVDYEVEETLRDYMEPMVEKYESIQSGFLPPVALTQDETRLVEQYQEQKEILKQKGLNKTNNKKLELKQEKPKTESGITTLVIILELAIVGMYILTFLSLAK